MQQDSDNAASLQKRLEVLEKENAAFRTYCANLYSNQSILIDQQIDPIIKNFSTKIQYELGLIDQSKLRELMVKSKRNRIISQNEHKPTPMSARTRKYSHY